MYKFNPLINYILDTARSQENIKLSSLGFLLKLVENFTLNNSIESTNISFIENRPFWNDVSLIEYQLWKHKERLFPLQSTIIFLSSY